VEEVKKCAIEYNSMIEPQDRIPIILVIAQAIQETGYGTSRFYEEANNLFGIIALEGEDYIESLGINKKKMRRYETKCDSVNHYMELLVTDINYKEFQEILINQYVMDEINVNKLISSLYNYAEDQFYGRKLRRIVKKVQNNYL
jgi:Bax protein|tara:strand:- start:1071 stop:1502 length:432 start_codon:yes stop_codon:yes gene_type:complete